MIKNKLTLTIIISFSFLLYSCQTVKEAVGGKKRSEQSDEFLVQKKNPLAMPPDYDELPAPGKQEVSPETFSDENEVKDLLNIKGGETSEQNNNDNSSDLESSILEKIQ
tara:strand:+ start:1618 stop:1944 length:327 start_codon:yes stop_codon:yes gene_type:complete